MDLEILEKQKLIREKSTKKFSRGIKKKINIVTLKISISNKNYKGIYISSKY